MDLLESLTSDMVMEDHGSTRGVILGISEPYNDGTTTILLGTLSKQYELSNKLISDRRAHSVLHKSEQLFGFKLTTNRPHYPWKEGTTKHIISEIWKLLFPTLYYNKKPHTTRKTAQQKQAPKPERPFIRYQNSTFPIVHHHNMFLRKTKSTPIFKTSSILDDENERLNRNINHLQTMIDDMIKEYEYMDQPLKFPQKQGSSSITPTTDNSILLNQRNDQPPN